MITNPNCSKCGAETTWRRNPMRAEVKLCPECYHVSTLGPKALLECMECDERAVLKVEKPEFACKPCRIKTVNVKHFTKGAIYRRGDSFEDGDGMDNSARLLEGRGRG